MVENTVTKSYALAVSPPHSSGVLPPQSLVQCILGQISQIPMTSSNEHRVDYSNPHYITDCVSMF